MGLFIRKTVKAGKTTNVNLSKSGASVSKKAGPVTVNSRGNVSIRVAKGVSLRKKLF